MKQYIVTDPCYIIDNDTWQNICTKIFDNMPQSTSEEYKAMLDAFDTEVTRALQVLTNAKAIAGRTGIGDWSNRLYGPNIKHSEFGADSGMFCFCEVTDTIKPALESLPEYCYALFEGANDIKVKMNVNNDWSMLYADDSEGNHWETDDGYDDGYDDDDDDLIYYDDEEDIEEEEY